MLKEHKLAPVQMPAENQMESLPRFSRSRIVGTKHLAFGRNSLLLGSPVSYGIRRPPKRFVFQPMTACVSHGLSHARESDPSIVIPSNGCDRCRSGHACNKHVQRLQSTLPVHQVSAEQDDVGALPRHDPENVGDHVPGRTPSEVQVAGKEDSLADLERWDSFAPDKKRSARSDFQMPQEVHRGKRTLTSPIASSQTDTPASINGVAAGSYPDAVTSSLRK